MLADLIRYLSGKRVLVWGFGREGQSTARFFHGHLPGQVIHVADAKVSEIVGHLKGVGPIELRKEEVAVNELDKYDLVIKSPGISLSVNRVARKLAARVRGQSDLFLQFAPGTTVGVTGTKGKSTTASLLAHLLRDGKRRVLLGGNIGVPPWDLWGEVSSRSVTVLELSSYQLERSSVSPHVAVMTNLYQEHLNYHGSIEAYGDAKWNIVQHQSARHDFFYHAGDVEIARRLREQPVRSRCHPIEPRQFEAELAQSSTKLRGEHNLLNTALAWAVARHLGGDGEGMRERLASFEALPHRLEYLGENGGIRWFNDSISTVPQATIAALAAIPETGVVIIGGQDRGVDLAPLAVALERQRELCGILLMGETGRRLKELLPTDDRVRLVGTLTEAVHLARSLLPKGGTCLLSPAAPSYDQFKNFEERGKVFVQAISSSRIQSSGNGA